MTSLGEANPVLEKVSLCLHEPNFKENLLTLERVFVSKSHTYICI